MYVSTVTSNRRAIVEWFNSRLQLENVNDPYVPVCSAHEYKNKAGLTAFVQFTIAGLSVCLCCCVGWKVEGKQFVMVRERTMGSVEWDL